MTHDDLNKLQAALKASPAPDPIAKAAALARAVRAFQHSAQPRQESHDRLRPIADRPKRAGLLEGVRHMLTRLKSGPMLAATTSAAALAVGVFVMLPQNAPHGPLAPPVTSPAPEIASPAPRSAAPQPAAAKTAETAMPATIAAETGADPLGRMVADAPQPPTLHPADTDEVFANAPANPVKITADDPVSTFSIDVDTASYAMVRNALNAGTLPDPEMVRVEEMVNYFPYTLPAPKAGEPPFHPSITVMPTPWNPGTRLVQIALQGRMPATDDRPPLNLVFLIDTSGSMDAPQKLPLLRQSLGLMLGALRPQDQVAIVAYAGSAGQVLAPTPATDRATIMAALDGLSAGGSTAGAAGLQLAYQLAQGMGGQGAVNRVLLATDGDFNLGIDDPKGLAAYVARKRDSGVYLSVLGFGRGTLDDAVMQSLAQSGNGTAAYIDTLAEARKVLVDQVTGALFPIAADVKIQVEWNPAQVAEYRLIGYETRALRREDFNNDAVDAGDIGAGHQVTAIYEVTAPGSAALLHDPLRYATPAPPTAQGPELGFLRLRYKAPGEEVSALIEAPIPQTSTAPPPQDARFAAAIAGMGQLLRGSDYLHGWGWDQAIELALGARGADPFGYRIEAVNLMRAAQALSR